MSRDLARSGSKPDARATPDTPHAPVLLPLRARSRASSLLQVPQRPQHLAQTKTVPDLAQIPSQTTIKCRSELAREGGLPVTNQSPDTPPSPASRLFGFCVLHKICGLPRSTVGARLPAKAVCLSRINRLTRRLRQQAGSYGFCVHHKICGLPRSRCRSELARESGVPDTNQSPDNLPSRASALLRLRQKLSAADPKLKSRVSTSASIPPPSTGFWSWPDKPSAPGSAPPAHWST